eukprot:scaffold436_cov267-Pinguiococcus_pyrenoidosus.AAC.29
MTLAIYPMDNQAPQNSEVFFRSIFPKRPPCSGAKCLQWSTDASKASERRSSDAKGAFPVFVSDELINLRLTSKQMLRSAEKSKKNEASMKSKLKKAIQV